MSKLVAPNQSSFVPGRQTVDNIIVVQEVIHYFKRRKARSGVMAWKIDMEKAYDRISWDFLKSVLVEIGLPCKLIELIMNCVTTPMLSVIWNGEKTDFFQPKRGLRQGDPISPYLFVLCMEKLSHMIEDRVKNKIWKPIKISKKGLSISHVFFADDLVLFSEATVEQCQVVMDCLNEFCKMSGEKINIQKSRIMVSNNTSNRVAQLIKHETLIPLTTEFGKYLGAPILQGRVGKATYNEILDRVKKRISGWKASQLSMAGRLTLVQAVTSTMATHVMQTTKLPTSVCREIDKCNRNFIWGHDEGSRKIHLVGWNNICKEKVRGGLNIRSMEESNEALLAKLGWRMLTDRSALWTKLMTDKYLNSEDFLTGKPPHGSYTWSSVLKGRELLNKGIRWRVGSGNKINMWTDIWVDSEPLVLSRIARENWWSEEELVADYIVEGSWDYVKLRVVLPEEIVHRITAIPLGGEDRRIWGQSADGQFTVASAYRLAKNSMSENQFNWAKIWRLRVLPRIKTFLWLAVRNRILSNDNRVRRRIASNAMCGFCGCRSETVMHILRNCIVAKKLWRSLGANLVVKNFWAEELVVWFENNLSANRGRSNGMEWCVLFATTCWLLWTWRNKRTFDQNFHMPINIRKTVVAKARELVADSGLVNSRRKKEELIKWVLPPLGWVKLNTDGCSKGATGRAGAGGLIRSETGDCLASFSCNIGFCTNDTAELWAIRCGLELAWNKGYRQVEVESDSTMAIDMIKNGVSQFHPLLNLVDACRNIADREWQCKFKHCYREGNFCADWLATFGISHPSGLIDHIEPPAGLGNLLLDDTRGVSRPRSIVV